MKDKAKLFVGAFLAATVIIGGLAGIMVVDLATDRYMPGQFSRIFLVEEAGPEGAAFSWMGQSYSLDPLSAGRAQSVLWRYRGLLPTEPRIASKLAGAAMELYKTYR